MGGGGGGGHSAQGPRAPGPCSLGSEPNLRHGPCSARVLHQALRWPAMGTPAPDLGAFHPASVFRMLSTPKISFHKAAQANGSGGNDVLGPARMVPLRSTGTSSATSTTPTQPFQVDFHVHSHNPPSPVMPREPFHEVLVHAYGSPPASPSEHPSPSQSCVTSGWWIAWPLRMVSPVSGWVTLSYPKVGCNGSTRFQASAKVLPSPQGALRNHVTQPGPPTVCLWSWFLAALGPKRCPRAFSAASRGGSPGALLCKVAGFEVVPAPNTHARRCCVVLVGVPGYTDEAK